MKTGNCIDCGVEFSFEPITVLGVEVFARRCCHACQERRETEGLAEIARENRQKLEAAWREICPGTYRATDPQHPAINQKVLAAVLSWRPGGKGLGLTGAPGMAKTRMIFLLLRDLHFAGIGVCYVRATELARLASTMFDDDEKHESKARLKRIYNAPVLFIDDLGKERYTDRVSERFYDLIETRGTERPTLWTTNHRGSELETMIGKERGPAIYRRLREFSIAIDVKAPAAAKSTPERQRRAA